MKANEAPERIWIDGCSSFACETTDDSVEYVRKDAFIEKAWNWFEDNLLSSNQQDKSLLYYERFKKYMND